MMVDHPIRIVCLRTNQMMSQVAIRRGKVQVLCKILNASPCIGFTRCAWAAKVPGMAFARDAGVAKVSSMVFAGDAGVAKVASMVFAGDSGVAKVPCIPLLDYARAAHRGVKYFACLRGLRRSAAKDFGVVRGSRKRS